MLTSFGVARGLVRQTVANCGSASALFSAAAHGPWPRMSCSTVLRASDLTAADDHVDTAGASTSLAVLLTEEELARRVEHGQLPTPIAADFGARRGAAITLYGREDKSVVDEYGLGLAAHQKAPLYSRLVLAGLGKATDLDADALRAATHAAVARFRELGVGSATIQLPAPSSLLPGDFTRCSAPPPHCAGGIGSTTDAVEIVAGTALLSNYRFGHYLGTSDGDGRGSVPSDKTAPPPELSSISVHVGGIGREETEKELKQSEGDTDRRSRDIEAAIRRATAFADGTCLARELANERADVATPGAIERVMHELAAQYPSLSCESLDAAALHEHGLRMMLAVGQGAEGGTAAGGSSDKAPRLVLLRHEGDPSAPDEWLGLVGKGVCYDTGGLNLKPTDFIEDMHLDMGGAAAVIGAMSSAARLGVRRNVVAAVALVENAIGPAAYKPHAILTAHNGLSVEVGNTDAEGRLVLADAMSYLQAIQADQGAALHTVIDVATLTGACVVALGEYAAGLFTHDDELAASLGAASQRAAERVWRMPLLPEHSAELGGGFSDLRSIGKGRMGGACTAAAFLSHFVRPGVRWAHLDIAGPAMYSEARGAMPKGGTGFGSQLLAQLMLDMDTSVSTR